VEEEEEEEVETWAAIEKEVIGVQEEEASGVQ
jgi:hypothetical protein